MTGENFPALFKSADEASNASQRRYLSLIRAEYLVLVVAALLTMPWSSSPYFYAGYALVFVLSIVLLLIRKMGKLEQSWYHTRALAESIKTSSWRYMMRTPPFNRSENTSRKEFVDLLLEILSSNKAAGQALAYSAISGDQVTDEMESTRSSDIAYRKKKYLSERIDDQCNWYASKAAFNVRAGRRWVIICICIYVVAGGLVLSRIVAPHWHLWPIAPLLVGASSVLGWMQIKKFGELSSAYALTSQEIGLIKARFRHVDTEEDFSEFVNEAELAFSREHTQWIARQHM